MTRLLEAPLQANVEVTAGIPVRVTAGGRGRPVEQVCARWRVDSDWWRRPVSREYWKLVLGGAEALLCDLYRDQLTGEWWISRLYD
ncbi:MAG: hypothetical protein NVSMB17_11200 [Candidatus Dormibacteria bacterium]